MPNKQTAVVAVIGLLLASAAFVIGLITGASNAAVSSILDSPNELCFIDTSPDQFSEQHAETKLVGCQVVGMSKQDAIAYAENSDVTVRIASEEGESFAMTEDYSDSRINLNILVGLVVSATAW
jgi:hypothetical protein